MMQSRMGDKPKTRAEMEEARPDPLFFATAFKKPRFYCFSTREPAAEDDGGLGRDVFNERPTAEMITMESVPSAVSTAPPPPQAPLRRPFLPSFTASLRACLSFPLRMLALTLTHVLFLSFL